MRRLAPVAIVLFCVALACGCSSIMRETHFAPCAKPDCDRCHGTGTYRCPDCQGRGYERCSSCDGTGSRRCYNCSGSGRKDNLRCVTCVGTGRARCPICEGSGNRECRTCDKRGMVPCGTTSYTWVCRQCGSRYDYPPQPCPKCGAK